MDCIRVTMHEIVSYKLHEIFSCQGHYYNSGTIPDNQGQLGMQSQ